MTTTPTTGAEMPEALRTATARAIWAVLREHEDRCDMELEDMGERCHAWALADAALSVAEPAVAPAITEKDMEKALHERDESDEFIDALLDEVLGADRPEWSSAYGRAEALRDVQERVTALHAPSVNRAWDRFQAAAPQQGETAGAVYAPPVGFVQVPEVPTEAMIAAGYDAYGVAGCYAAMLAAAPHAAAASGAPASREREIAIAKAVLEAVEAINEGDANGRTYRAALGWVVAHLNEEVAAKLAYHDKGVSALPIAREALAKAESATVAAAPMSAEPVDARTIWAAFERIASNLPPVLGEVDAAAMNTIRIYLMRAAQVGKFRPASPTTVQAVHPACKPDMLVNGGALKLALNVLRRAGKDEVANELEKTAAPASGGEAQAEGDRGAWLNPNDMAALERVDEVFQDGEGYDVPAEQMKRMAELGVVRHHSAGRYSITSFGRWVLGSNLLRKPLETADECNARLGEEHRAKLAAMAAKSQKGAA